MKNILVASLIIFLAACVTNGKIKSNVVQIEDRVFEVRNTVTVSYGYGVDSRAASSADQANAMLFSAANKSAELGCEYFVATENSSQSFNTPQSEITEGLSRLNNGQVIYKTAQGQIYTVKRPAQDANVFVCFSEKPNALLPGLVFNTKYVKQSLTN